MWLPRWIGELYTDLHVNFGGEAFHFEDALRLSKSTAMAKAALAKLKGMGCLYVHGRSNRRRIYRLCDPEVLIYILSGKITNLWMFKQGRYCRLIGLASIGILRKISNVRSIVVYGSVARGTAGEDSDVDMLVIMEGAENLGERLDKLLKVESIDRIGEELDWLYRNGVDTHISFLPLNPEEAKFFPPILLDVIHEGIPIFDDGFYASLVREKTAILSRLKARRVSISEDEWFWDLKPDVKLGEVIEI